tara:strand:- start:13725 stop:13898 length:174 start_codon:yes stop_codon:yes gene_type:complete
MNNQEKTEKAFLEHKEMIMTLLRNTHSEGVRRKEVNISFEDWLSIMAFENITKGMNI